ncbi:LuxR C-terminal-related transcriptional regulator [Streptomyces sp. NPDC060194]|uniref:helix-turn-helix transcriptional regulator n=1 Tax=Streptomyces sp. NPDC060194 TaxID=3347069 RepID=UPI003665C433
MTPPPLAGPPPATPLRLYGRSDELAAVRDLSDRVRYGRGATLVVAGPPGRGRTGLLAYARAHHRRHGPAVATGARTLADDLRAVLAAGLPALLSADDAHTWSPAARTALLAAAYRHPVAVLLALDEHTPAPVGTPRLLLGPLDAEAAGALLDRTARYPLDPLVRADLIERAAGNPKRLLALLAGLGADRNAGRVARFSRPAGASGGAPHPRAVARPADGHALADRGLRALRNGPAADARETLLAAAALLAPHDPGRAATALLGAAEAAWSAGDPAGYADALGRVPATAGRPDDARHRAGMTAVLAGRTAQGHALLRSCLAAAGADDDPGRLLRAAGAALVLGEVDTACRTGARALAAVHAHGPLEALPRALERVAHAELRAGRHSAARAHAVEGLRAARGTGQTNTEAALHAVLALAASVEGDMGGCAAHAAAATAVAGPHGLAQTATLAVWAVARAELAAGRAQAAAARLAPLVGTGPRRGHFAVRMAAVPCFVEAAVRAGRPAEARPAVEEFARWAARTADPLAPAQLARCHALLAADDRTARAAFGTARTWHDRAAGDFERSRTRLLEGEWLRRRRRPREAREPLRDALVGFERAGAAAWADRARGELRAAGESAAARGDGADAPGAAAALTPQQLRIARQVAEGATNREVADRLSVSPRTVDHHLRNVFAALGVRSRVELARLLGAGASG